MSMKTKNTKIEETDDKFLLYIDGKQISRIKYFVDTDDESFDWIYLYDAYTKKLYRHKGYMLALMDYAVKKIDMMYPSKGQYLMVKKDNTLAISLYKKIGFKRIRDMRDIETDEIYIIMANRRKNINQLITMDCGGFEDIL